MNIPFVFGLPQLILLLIALIGIGLLISAFASLAGRGRREYGRHEEEEEKFAKGYRRSWRRPRIRWGRGIGGIVLVFFAISLLWLTFLVQTYLGLTSDIKAATVHATKIANADHMMDVELILFDQNGNQTSDQTYQVNGDRWRLEGDIIKFPYWLNILGLHSGYKVTRLEGEYDDPVLEGKSMHKVITLNGGDDNFFKTVQPQAWTSPFVDAAYGNATYLEADGKTYNVFVSQTGLYAKPAK